MHNNIDHNVLCYYFIERRLQYRIKIEENTRAINKSNLNLLNEDSRI